MSILVATVILITILSGAPWLVVAAASTMAVSPFVGIAGLGIAAVFTGIRGRRSRRIAPADEAVLMAELAGAVSAGSTLRQAISASTHDAVDVRVRRLCRTGAPMAAVADALEPHLRVTGRNLSIVARLSETTGTAIAAALHLLAEEADDVSRSHSELRVASAQSRFSAVVVGVAPLVVAVLITVVRGVPDPGGALVVVPMAVGAAMMVTGTLVVFAAARRAST